MTSTFRISDWQNRLQINELNRLLFWAATVGSVTMIDKACSQFNMSNHSTGNRETPIEKAFVIACSKGHHNFVQHLVEKYKVNPNKYFSVWRGGDRIVNETPLHTAILSHSVQLVDYLVKVCKVNINAITLTASGFEYPGSSTALHLAVKHLDIREQIKPKKDQRYEMIGYLLANGADWNICDGSGKQCWELTSDVDLTKFMISFGVGLDSSWNSTLSNIAHLWAKSNDVRSSEVVEFALTKGVNLNLPDENGFTPLMAAAFRHKAQPNDKVLKCVLRLCNRDISRLDKILSYELIGACFILSSNKKKDKDKGLRYWKKAIKLRSGTRPPIPTPILTDGALFAFQHVWKVETLQDLEVCDSDSLVLQAHLTCFRILGLNHWETLEHFFSYAVHMWEKDQLQFLAYSRFILESCNLMEKDVWVVCREVLFAYIYTLKFIGNSLELNNFDYAMPVLRKLVDILKQMRDPVARWENQPSKRTTTLVSILNLVDVMVNSSVNLNATEEEELKRCLYEAVRLKTKNTKGYDLLLLSCIPLIWPIRDSYFENVTGHHRRLFQFQRSISADIIKLFLEVGADPTSTNTNGDTGLHLLARYSETLDTELIRVMQKAGTHVDQLNLNGHTAADIKFFIPPEVHPLKCLCARAYIKSYTLYEESYLTSDMIDFIRLH